MYLTVTLHLIIYYTVRRAEFNSHGIIRYQTREVNLISAVIRQKLRIPLSVQFSGSNEFEIKSH